MAQSKVLIVEDDEGLREALVDTLALAGYEWLEADCAEDALVKLKSNAVDIVVSDVQMAGMGGLALLRNIKQNWPNLPVLLMTAYANIEDAVSAMKEGAIDYMAKPFAPEVLLNMVSRYAPIKSDDNGDAVVADEKSLRLLALADKVARTDANVMILGQVAPVKKSCPVTSTMRLIAKMALLSQSTVQQSQTTCLKRRCSATRKVRLPVRFKRVRVSLSKHKAVLFCWMKSVKWT